MIDPDCEDRTVVEAEVRVDGPVIRLLRGIFPTFMEGAVAYGAALHGYPSTELSARQPNRTANEQILAWPMNSEAAHDAFQPQ